MPTPGYSPKRRPFARKVPRARKATLGRTTAAETPLAIRPTGIETTPALEAHVRKHVGFKLGKFAPRIERVTVRFKDVNGPRGGIDTLCRIKVVLSRLSSVVVEELASDPSQAFARAINRVERAVRRDLGRARGAGTIQRLRMPRGATKAARREAPADQALGGRREGRSLEQLVRAQESAGPSTAARNTQLRARKATATLEDSLQERPSRKSTRRSANRAKQGSKLGRRQTSRITSSKSKARRNAARQQ